ncbi:MAG: ATP-grasp domain-containing protein [Balneolaceae bacterium]
MTKITSILLCGAENIIALPIIRSLGVVLPNAKIHTFSPLERKKSISERSRYIASRHYFNSWNDDFPDKLKAKIQETNADILLPVGDNSVRNLASLKEELKKIVHLPPLPELNIYDQLERKDLMAELLTAYNFPNPETWHLATTDPKEIDADFFPLLLKPIIGSSGDGIIKINSSEALIEKTADIDTDKYILQELIPGQDVGCSVLAVDGHIKAYTIQKVLGHKEYGVATAIKFIDNDAVFEQTRRLIEKTGYSGVAHLDYRIDKRDNQPKLVDFNARFWFSVLGSKAAGVDFILLCFLSAFDVPFNRPEYKKIIYFAGRDSLRYYFKKIFSPTKLYQNNSSVYTDLWDRIGDPMPELARYIK